MSKQYRGPSERVDVLRDVNLTILAGESLAILGASGSGKTTLLHMMGALDIPTSGKIFFLGKTWAPCNRARRQNS